ncbi:MAG: DUF4911 domain-containing protein [Desulfopila sp.]
MTPIRQEELFLRIRPDLFHYLKFILEGYDNLAVLSSHDRTEGIVRLRYLSSSREELFVLIGSLAARLHPCWRSTA